MASLGPQIKGFPKDYKQGDIELTGKDEKLF